MLNPVLSVTRAGLSSIYTWSEAILSWCWNFISFEPVLRTNVEEIVFSDHTSNIFTGYTAWLVSDDSAPGNYVVFLVFEVIPVVFALDWFRLEPSLISFDRLNSNECFRQKIEVNAWMKCTSMIHHPHSSLVNDCFFNHKIWPEWIVS